MDFPYDITNLLGGAVRILYAPTSQAIPAKPSDVFAQVGPYAVAGSWLDFGATRDASTYDRAFTATSWEVQQADAAVVRKPATATRRVSVSVAEINDKAMQIVEQAPSIGTLAAVAGSSAFKEVGMAEIDSFARYRVAFVSLRDESAGLVTEPATATPPSGTRGRMVMGVGWECSITADTAALEQARGAMSAIPLVFEFYPVPAQVKGKRYGVWWLEQTGTIT